MWIKASGKWLIDTGSSETMVAVSISKIKDAKNNNCSYDDILKSVDLINSPKGFVHQLNPNACHS